MNGARRRQDDRQIKKSPIEETTKPGRLRNDKYGKSTEMGDLLVDDNPILGNRSVKLLPHDKAVVQWQAKRGRCPKELGITLDRSASAFTTLRSSSEPVAAVRDRTAEEGERREVRNGSVESSGRWRFICWRPVGLRGRAAPIRKWRCGRGTVSCCGDT